jgi:predicted nucleotidyltransferase
MTPHLQAVLREPKAGLQDLYGSRLAGVLLYGSQARGDADEDSDIDVLIVLKGECKPGEEIRRTSRLIVRLSLKYDTLLSRMFVSETDFAKRRDPLIGNVQREGVPL